MDWQDDNVENRVEHAAEHQIGPEDADLFAEGHTSVDDEPCPACGKLFLEEIELCPYCGHWREKPLPSEVRSSGWLWPIVVGASIALFLMYMLG